jgi:hypothetical protein
MPDIGTYFGGSYLQELTANDNIVLERGRVQRFTTNLSGFRELTLPDATTVNLNKAQSTGSPTLYILNCDETVGHEIRIRDADSNNLAELDSDEGVLVSLAEAADSAGKWIISPIKGVLHCQEIVFQTHAFPWMEYTNTHAADHEPDISSQLVAKQDNGTYAWSAETSFPVETSPATTEAGGVIITIDKHPLEWGQSGTDGQARSFASSTYNTLTAKGTPSKQGFTFVANWVDCFMFGGQTVQTSWVNWHRGDQYRDTDRFNYWSDTWSVVTECPRFVDESAAANIDRVIYIQGSDHTMVNNDVPGERNDPPQYHEFYLLAYDTIDDTFSSRNGQQIFQAGAASLWGKFYCNAGIDEVQYGDTAWGLNDYDNWPKGIKQFCPFSQVWNEFSPNPWNLRGQRHYCRGAAARGTITGGSFRGQVQFLGEHQPSFLSAGSGYPAGYYEEALTGPNNVQNTFDPRDETIGVGQAPTAYMGSGMKYGLATLLVP